MTPFTLYDLVANAARKWPQKIALIAADGEELSYAELQLRTEALARRLLADGIHRGDRVVICLPKSVDEIVAVFATACAGAVFVNVNYQWSEGQLMYVLEDCEAACFISDERRIARVASTMSDKVPLRYDVGDPGASAYDDRALPKIIDCDLAGLLYTSGSTGSPKGVMLSHRNIVLGAQSVATYLDNTQDDHILSVPPLSFDYGLNQVTTMLLVGGTVSLQPVPMATEIAIMVQSRELTGLALVAPSWIQLVNLLVEADLQLDSLRYISNTGGSIPRQILEQLPNCFPNAAIYLMYGLTEAFRSTYLPPAQFSAKMGAIGYAIPNAEIFVVDPEEGVRGPGDPPGELVHRGALISRGYWNKQDASAEKIHPNKHLSGLIGDEPVLHSGDQVRLDEDGCLWFVSRMDGLIKTLGHRVSPNEVEDIVSAFDGVDDAVAFGVADDELGQSINVAIAVDSVIDTDTRSLLKWCRSKMPTYMVPRTIHPWSGPFPKTPSGKNDRNFIINQLKTAIQE